MKEQLCGIYMQDEGYAYRLMGLMNEESKFLFRPVVFTSIEKLQGFVETQQLTVLLFDEELTTDEVMQLPALYKVILTEGKNRTEFNQFDEKMDYISLFKYQKATQIMERIMKECAGETVRQTTRARVVGVYALADAVARTSFSLLLAEEIAKKDTNTLFISLDQFSGTTELLAEVSDNNLSDLLYEFRKEKESQQKEQFRKFVSSMIGKCATFHYIAPVRCAQDIEDLSEREWKELIEWLSEEVGFDAIIINIGTAVKCPWILFDSCDRIYMTISDCDAEARMCNDFDTYLLEMGMEQIQSEIKKVAVTRGTDHCWNGPEFFAKGGYLEEAASKEAQSFLNE